MRIVVDLDGTICNIKEPNESYADVLPKPGAVEGLQKLRANGHTIIIQTARNMATRRGNVGKVLKHVGRITLDWLDEHNIEYDEIHFGKPNAHLYIDDRGFRFSGWDNISDSMINELGSER